MSGVGILVGIVLFGAALLRVLLAVARASDGALPVIVPPGFVASVFAADLGAPRALAVDPGGTLIVSIPVGVRSSRCALTAPERRSRR
jgi:hypothetical protein